MAFHILVVEDHEQVVNLLRQVLNEQGYDVATAGDGVEALAQMADRAPDLILLDVMMPRMDGFEFMRQLRERHATPVIFLTARMDEIDLLTGFSLGADDYLHKPFSMSELCARIKAVLRRSADLTAREDVKRVGGIAIDRPRRQVTVHGKSVSLTRTEFELLDALAEAGGRVLSRPQLMERMFGDLYEVTEGFDRTVDVHVKNLRAKLEASDSNMNCIETVYGVGYRFQVAAE